MRSERILQKWQNNIYKFGKQLVLLPTLRHPVCDSVAHELPCESLLELGAAAVVVQALCDGQHGRLAGLAGRGGGAVCVVSPLPRPLHHYRARTLGRPK